MLKLVKINKINQMKNKINRNIFLMCRNSISFLLSLSNSLLSYKDKI